MSATVATRPAQVRIVVFTDFTCPWCYIGKRRLEAVLAAWPGLEYEIDWRAFQRDPSLPRDGMPFETYLSRAAGTFANTTLSEIGAAGRAVGLAFAFDKITYMPNTFDAHRLVYWAYPARLKTRIAEALFKAHFIDGANIGDRNLLITLAQQCGMDGDAAFDLFARRDDIDVLRREIEVSRNMIKQVPFFVFADDVVVPGGQSEDELRKALAKAVAKAA